MLERRFQPAVNDSLYYLSPAADRSVLRSLCAPLAGTEARRWPRSRLQPLPPLQVRTDLAKLLEAEGMRHGVEVGVKKGRFSQDILSGWRSCVSYMLVDLWQPQHNYRDRANVGASDQERSMRITLRRLEPHARRLLVCRNFSVVCATRIADASLDFAYIDARHDYKGVLEDLAAFWPKLRRGGIMAGHDYLTANEIPAAGKRDPTTGALEEDWSVSADGSREARGPKGAVDDFFSEACVPRQVVVTYRETVFNSWMVRK